MDTFEWRSAAVYMTAVREALTAEQSMPEAQCRWSIVPYHLAIAASEYNMAIVIQSCCMQSLWRERQRRKGLYVCSRKGR